MAGLAACWYAGSAGADSFSRQPGVDVQHYRFQLEVWVFPQDRERGFRGFEPPARSAIELFSERLGPFPYQKLANALGQGDGRASLQRALAGRALTETRDELSSAIFQACRSRSCWVPTTRVSS